MNLHSLGWRDSTYIPTQTNIFIEYEHTVQNNDINIDKWIDHSFRCVSFDFKHKISAKIEPVLKLIGGLESLCMR